MKFIEKEKAENQENNILLMDLFIQNSKKKGQSIFRNANIGWKILSKSMFTIYNGGLTERGYG